MVIPPCSQLRACVVHHQFGGVLLGSLALVSAVGCSTQNFDYLTSGAGGSTNLPSVGGKSAVGGASRTTQGSGGTVSGTGGDTSSAQGGATPLATGGAPATGGAIATGGSPGGGDSSGPCPAYTGTGGSVVTPPSNSFDSSVTGWSTTAEMTAPLVAVTTGWSCEGTGHLLCNGSGRSGGSNGWDGPGINLLPYLVAGHQYVVTVAARFDPANAPSSGGALTLVVALACADSSVTAIYANLQQSPATTSWIRLTGNLPAPTMSGCTNLMKEFMYVQSDDSDSTRSIDLDDFRLIDVTSVRT